MKKETWKPVTISGFTGILMGAASSYGVQNAMASEVTADNLPDAVKTTAANDDLSFKHAFEAARAELGPGGVFTWRGKLYNTYTAEEWNAKTHHEKQLFAEKVAPQLDLDKIEEPDDDVIEEPDDDVIEEPDEDVAEAEISQTDEDDVQIASVPSENDSTGDNLVSKQSPAAEDAPTEEVPTSDTASNATEDVRVVGFGDVQLENGRVITVEELDFNGQRVAVVDLDQDGTPDVGMSDLNHNNQADEGEVIDLHTGEALTFTNDTVDTNDDLPVFDA